jgi:hypothetical protein
MILQTGTPHVDVEEVRGPTKLGREREAHRLRDPLAASVRGARRRPPQVVFRIGKHSVLRGDELGENVGAFPATAIAHKGTHNARNYHSFYIFGYSVKKLCFTMQLSILVPHGLLVFLTISLGFREDLVS